MAMSNTLNGVRAEDIMTRDIPSVPRDISLEEYLHEVLKTGRQYHLVTGAGNPVGTGNGPGGANGPREEWANTSIQAVMQPIEKVQSVSPTEPVLGILERMQKEEVSQMPVISDGHIIGIIARDTILRVLQTRLQIGHLA